MSTLRGGRGISILAVAMVCCPVGMGHVQPSAVPRIHLQVIEYERSNPGETLH